MSSKLSVSALIAIALFTQFLIYKSAMAFPSFEYHQIDEFGNKLARTSLFDVDNDNDLDWVVGGRNLAIYWYEYRGPDTWVQRVLYNKPSTESLGAQAYDFNGDGHVDLFSGEKWYENPGNPRSASFIPHNAGKACHDNAIGDIDGDGIVDGVSVFNQGSGTGFFWYKIGSNPEAAWITNRIDGGIHGGADPCGIGDLDGDGDNDIVRAHIWYENANGLGTSWIKHTSNGFLGRTSGTSYGEMTKDFVVDFDNDGDLDVVQAEGDIANGRVAWHENVNGDASRWTNHIVKNYSNQDFHSLCVEDFDNDGDLDIFSGGGPLTTGTHTCFIWENTDGAGGSFTEHIILTGKRGHEAQAGDVDGDGDIDICSKPWNGNLHFYLKNMHVESGGITQGKYKLGQNLNATDALQISPNPFNPSAEISVRIGTQEKSKGSKVVSLEIFNILGVRLSNTPAFRLSDSIEGLYTSTWDASGLPGGFYIIAVGTDNAVYSQKAFLSK